MGLIFFPLSLIFAFLISFCFDYFIGLIAFYTESVWGLSITKEIVITVFSGALIPLQFFPEAIRKVLLILPFQAIYHTPLMMVTRPGLGIDTYLPMLAVQLIWVVALYAMVSGVPPAIFHHRGAIYQGAPAVSHRLYHQFHRDVLFQPGNPWRLLGSV
jgi:ABC-2 type transport system permease protein